METIVDLLRLSTAPIFLWAGWSDLQTRRINDLVWVGVVSLGIVGLLLDLYLLDSAVQYQYQLRLFLLSVGSVGGLGIIFARMGWFGWADAGAFISIGVVFPLYGSTTLAGIVYPTHSIGLSLWSVAIVSNAAILSLFSPLFIGGFNALNNSFSFPHSLYLLPLSPTSIWDSHGRVAYLGTSESKLRSAFLKSTDKWVRGADMDVIRRYLQWRRCSIDSVIDNPHTCRNADSIVETLNSPSSFDITEIPRHTGVDMSVCESAVYTDSETDTNDPWGVDRFCSETEVAMYGTTKDELRKSLDQLFVFDEPARVSMGQPFVVYLCLGIFSTFLVGNILYIFI